jgi:hypothetical protein
MHCSLKKFWINDLKNTKKLSLYLTNSVIIFIHIRFFSISFIPLKKHLFEIVMPQIMIIQTRILRYYKIVLNDILNKNFVVLRAALYFEYITL